MKLTNPLIGLAGAIVAAMSAELNAQVSGLALPDITAAMGMSHDAATWFSTLYASAIVVGMVIAPWLAVTFSLRRFFLMVIGLTAVSTILVPFCPNLASLYTVRTLQGLSQGLTIPLLMTTALRVLAPKIRLFGLAAYALTATFFPNLSFSVAAIWVDLLNWHYVFYQVLPLSFLAATLIWYGMPHDPSRFERFRKFDWLGFLLLVIGSGALTTMFEQGDRLDWFQSPYVIVMATVSIICLPLFLINEWFHELPLLKLQMLERRNLAYGVSGLFLFIVISLSSTELPYSYLIEVQGYRPLQAHLITLEIACSQLILLPAVAVLLDRKWLDSRWVSFVGLLCIFTACIGASFLDTTWNREQFYLWQGLQSIGEAAVVIPLLMMATNAVKGPHEGPFASALVNTPRAVAEALSVWLVQIIVRLRGGLHANRIVDTMGRQQFRLVRGAGVTPRFQPPLLSDGAARSPEALEHLGRRVEAQVAVLTFSDAFLIISGIVVLMMLLLLVLPVRTYPPRIALAKH